MPGWPEIVIGAKRWKRAIQVAVIALGGLFTGEMLEWSGFLSSSAIGKLGAAGGVPLVAAGIGGIAIVVGIVVVAQTLYASTKEHINEFATLRALGASSGFIRKVILWQAVLSALMGYVLGMVLAKIVTYLLSDMLPILMTFNLIWGLLALTVGMCVLAAVSAILKVVRIDPAVVFSR